MSESIFTYDGVDATGRYAVSQNGAFIMSFDTEKDARGYVTDRRNDKSHADAMKHLHRKIKARVTSRARASAMDSVGMKRTPYGWE